MKEYTTPKELQEASSCDYFTRAHKVLYFALCIALYVSGFASYPLVIKNLSYSMQLQENSDTRSYDEGFSTARKLIEEDERLGSFVRISDDIRNVTGTVLAVDGDRVFIHVPNNNPFEKVNEDINLTVNSDTQIIKRESKDATAYQNEKALFEEKLKLASSTDTQLLNAVPSPYNEISMQTTDLKPGDSINILASYNIKNLVEVTPSFIFVETPIF